MSTMSKGKGISFYEVHMKSPSCSVYPSISARRKIPHTDVTKYLNVSYRHVLYVMKQFRERGILSKDKGKGYRIIDMDKLKELKDI